MAEATTEVARIESAADTQVSARSVRDAIASMTEGKPSMLTTIPTDTFEGKRVAYGLMTTSESLEDQGMLGKPFNLANVIVHAVEMTDDETGAKFETARTILVDDEGNGYAAVSMGIFSALEDIFAFFGQPSEWENGILPVEVVQRKTRKGFRFFTINVL